MAARGAWAALAVGTALFLVGAAAAATPQQISQRIFADLADNGVLDGEYTPAQIDRALHNPSLRGYEQPPLPTPLRQPAAVAPAAGAAEPGRDSTLPFSGIDLAFLAAVGAPILLLGASLGRFARVKPEAS
jgi:hypothetical protein